VTLFTATVDSARLATLTKLLQMPCNGYRAPITRSVTSQTSMLSGKNTNSSAFLKASTLMFVSGPLHERQIGFSCAKLSQAGPLIEFCPSCWLVGREQNSSLLVEPEGPRSLASLESLFCSIDRGEESQLVASCARLCKRANRAPDWRKLTK